MPLLVSFVILPEFDTPAPPTASVLAFPLPPLIMPLLVSVVIVPALDTRHRRRRRRQRLRCPR